MSIAILSELRPGIIKDKMKLSGFMHNQGGKLLFFLVQEHTKQIVLFSRAQKTSYSFFKNTTNLKDDETND